MSKTTKRLVESAIMIALGTVLSLFQFVGPWALGGGITICSMLPLVILAHRYGTRWGVFAAAVFGALQLVLGAGNVAYATNTWEAVAIILLDYIIAYAFIGFAAVFDRAIKSPYAAITAGIIFAMSLRLASHFVVGWIVWEALWPNELGWASPIWSIAYNGSYMVPEMVITTAAALLLYKPLKRYFAIEK
jgi:thiamine transporter